MEFVIGLLAGTFGMWVMWICIVCALFVEHNESSPGWALFLSIVAAIIAVLAFHVPLSTVLWGALVYIPIGFVWSFWRFRRYGKHLQREVEENRMSKDTALRRLDVKNAYSDILMWIFTWPISFIALTCGDIIDVFTDLVRNTLRTWYDACVKSAKDGINK
jgi:hypothetical protein